MLYHLEQKHQKFITMNEGDGINTITISAGQSYAAVAAKSVEKGPFIVVCDLQNPRKRKTLTLPEGLTAKVRIIVLARLSTSRLWLQLLISPKYFLCSF